MGDVSTSLLSSSRSAAVSQSTAALTAAAHGGGGKADTDTGQSTYRLIRRPVSIVAPPTLDSAQQRVVEHGSGPLLVLAGPGTGKTTTIVEAVVDRIDHRGFDPEHILVLTFSRKAAGELRERISARLGRATKEPLARTFHSYAFGVLRREAALHGEPPPRLLSGPEQDMVVRDLLAGDLARGAGDWPPALLPALRTRGFAQELRDLLMRCYERGVDAKLLDRLGQRLGRADWRAAARFMKQYAGVTALSHHAAYDPAELIRAVVSRFLVEPALLARERELRRAVFVDEMQDTDPAQVELLALLAGEGRDLVVVGDPDQSIYAFRGADVDGIRNFPQRFPTATGEEAPIVALTRSRRAGAALLAATRRVAAPLGGSFRHRDLTASPQLPMGNVEAHVLRSESQQAAFVAHRLRQAHLVDGVPWSEMAVLVRSTVHHLSVLRRALTAAGVPLSVSGDEVPLVDQPAVTALLAAMRCALRPETLDEATAVVLLTSPLGGADVLGVRRLRQALRREELAVGGGRRPSSALPVEALADPRTLSLVEEHIRRPADRVVAILAAGQAAAAPEGATAEDVLWAVWSASRLAGRWQRRSLEGGLAGLAADRDLDAVVALFDAAARFVDRLPGAGAAVFLDHLLGQQIPADTLAARTPDGDAVQLLTAHASKGLEWDVVVVAGVQESSWPDLRMRGSFLGSEQLVELTTTGWGRNGNPAALTSEPVSAAMTLSRLLDEERRLFYVAVTRARRQLLVTAVESEREGLQPSRFLDDLVPLEDGSDRRLHTAPPRAMTLPALVAELRAVLLDDRSSSDVRAVAAAQLARLADAGIRGADPSDWWGLQPLSDERPLREPGEPVTVSPSKVESFVRCELRWFLEQAGGSDPATTSQSVGTLVHAVAALATDASEFGEAALLERLDELWDTADVGSGWHAGKERDRARAMLRRLASWLLASGRQVVATELDVEAHVGDAVLRGRIDRVERDDAGRAVVVDLKTGTRKVAADELPAHPQLGVYQLAVALGGIAGSTGLGTPGGAELVHLGKAAGSGTRAVIQRQQPLTEHDDPLWAKRLVADVASGMAGAAFQAMGNDLCRVCPVRTSCPAQDDGRVVTA